MYRRRKTTRWIRRCVGRTATGRNTPVLPGPQTTFILPISEDGSNAETGNRKRRFLASVHSHHQPLIKPDRPPIISRDHSEHRTAPSSSPGTSPL